MNTDVRWIDRLKQDIDRYRPLTFWSWNSELEEPLLRQQIGEMKEAGMGGFFMHARGGLRTPYMEEAWFHAVEVSMDEAEKNNMQAWCYDENGWPSGFAGMKLLEKKENFAHYLTFQENEYFDHTALAVYTLENGCLRRLLESDKDVTNYLTVYDYTNSSVVDVLNEEIVKQFIQLTHEKYYERYGQDFGNKLVGFFTDEPQYFRFNTAYSPVLQELYYELYGENLLDSLAALFVNCERCYQFRYRYWKLMSDQFVKSFAKQVYEWCETHHCQLTGHAIEESSLYTQMWCCAGVMPFYEYEHIPGCDWLGRDIGTEMTPKQVGSVAQQLGKKQVLTESFACTGWDVTPRELKRLLDWQYVNGVNTLCTHLTPYSLEGDRKFDHPTFFSKANPWFGQFRVFSDYAAKLGCMLAESKEYAPVGVIHPMHSAYLTYDRNSDYESIKELETDFQELIERLSSNNIPHHYIDETLLARYGEVCGKILKVGDCQYESIIIPQMQQLDQTTVDFLRVFVKNGGKLWLAGDAPNYICGELADLSFLKTNTTFDDLKSEKYSIETESFFIRSTYRISKKGDFIFLVNLDKEHVEEIILTVKAVGLYRLNLENNSQERIEYTVDGDTLKSKLRLNAGESAILLLEDVSVAKTETVPAGKVLFTEPVMIDSDCNILVIDHVRISYDNVEYKDIMPVPAAADYLLSQCENRIVYLKYTFNIQKLPQFLVIEMEKMNAKEVLLNGHSIELEGKGILDAHFISEDIIPYAVRGENELIIKLDYFQREYVYDVLYRKAEVTESLLNCLTFDTEISNVYLRGSFAVYSKEPLKKEENGIYLLDSEVFIGKPSMACMGDITGSGYPFFAGKVSFELDAKVERPGQIRLQFSGCYGTIRIRWNDYEIDVVLSEYVVIPADYVKKHNKVVVTLASGNRNLLGPHHWKPSLEPKHVMPIMFHMRNGWEGAKHKNYRNSYSLVPFGVQINQAE